MKPPTANLALVASDSNLNNQVFSSKCRDNVNQRWIKLRSILLNEYNIQLKTYDLFRPDEQIDATLYLNIQPTYLRSDSSRYKILIIGEPDIIHADNAKVHLASQYDIVYSWKRNLQHPNHYPYALGSSAEITFDLSDEEQLATRKLLCAIYFNKASSRKNELYSLRRQIIRTATRREMIDLYGVGWDKRVFTGICRPLNRVPLLRKAFYNEPRSYKGPVVNKNATLSQYQYSICIENFRTDDYWITEKIFDSMFSGCVPVYFGSSQVTEVIPPSTFVNYADFKSGSELLDYLSGLTTNEYMNYLLAISRYYETYKQSMHYSNGWAKHLATTIASLILT